MAIAEIDAILTEQVADHKTPSVQYLLFNKDRILHAFQNGLADILNQKQTSEQTRYFAYSVTKTFTALAVLQLAEQQKIAIEQPVKKYLPDFPYNPEITIKQLLTHSAGIPYPVPLSWIHLAGEHLTFDSRTFFQKIFRKYPKTKSKPNQKYAYSNLGYVLLGQLIETVSGKPYETYIRENILNAINLTEKELGFTTTDPDLQAKGYHKKNTFMYFLLDFFIDTDKFMDKTEGKWKSFRNNYVNGASYGGLIGTPRALAKYLQEFLKPDTKLLSAEYRKLLFTENFTVNDKPTGMCLSWFTGNLNGNKYFTHAGGGGGFYCEIRIYPDKGIGSVIMFNRTGMSDERFLDKVDRHFFE